MWIEAGMQDGWMRAERRRKAECTLRRSWRRHRARRMLLTTRHGARRRQYNSYGSGQYGKYRNEWKQVLAVFASAEVDGRDEARRRGSSGSQVLQE